MNIFRPSKVPAAYINLYDRLRDVGVSISEAEQIIEELTQVLAIFCEPSAANLMELT